MSRRSFNITENLSFLKQPGAEQSVTQMAVDELTPHPLQPRLFFDETALRELAGSIREKGVLQPLLVRPKRRGLDGHEIVAGERRWRAAQMAGLSQVPVIVRELSDADALGISIIENLQRENLSRLEEVNHKLTLVMIEFGLMPAPTNEAGLETARQETRELLHRVRNAPGKYQEEGERLTRLFSSLGSESWSSYVSNGLPLLTLDPELMNLVRSRQLSPSAAQFIARQSPHREALLKRSLQGANLAQLEKQAAEANGEGERAALKETQKLLTYQRYRRLSAAEQQQARDLIEQLRTLLNGH